MDLERIEARFKAARAEYGKALSKEYPEGTRVSMMLSSRQIVPSVGVVIGLGNPGSLRVRIDSMWGMVRDIHWQDIIDKWERNGEKE